jgi:hypothetical protein
VKTIINAQRDGFTMERFSREKQMAQREADFVKYCLRLRDVPPQETLKAMSKLSLFVAKLAAAKR